MGCWCAQQFNFESNKPKILLTNYILTDSSASLIPWCYFLYIEFHFNTLFYCIMWAALYKKQISRVLTAIITLYIQRDDNLYIARAWIPWGWFNIKMTSYQYRKSHCGDKTIPWLFYLHNRISYTGKMTSIYWIRALVPNIVYILNAASLHLPPCRH